MTPSINKMPAYGGTSLVRKTHYIFIPNKNFESIRKNSGFSLHPNLLKVPSLQRNGLGMLKTRQFSP